MKVYVPTEYYKHAGYIPKEGKVQSKPTSSVRQSLNKPLEKADAMQKERFNEELNYGKHGKKDEALSAYSRGPQSTVGGRPQTAIPQDKIETQSRAQSSYFKKRIIDKINMMDDKDLEKMGKNLNLEEKDEKASVITQDKLKQFNEIYGYDNGPAVEGDEEEEE